MIKSKERIYIRQWLDLKPYDNQTNTDDYYLNLANEVRQSIIANKQSAAFKIYLEKDGIDSLACFLTSYLEDLVAETDMDEILDKQMNAFMEFNNDQQIAFMNSDKIESYFKVYMEFLYQFLNVSKEQKEKARRKARE
ncbi:MAG: DUF3843 family protein [Bacteroidales bacterium]